MKLVGSRMAEGSGLGRLCGESQLVAVGRVEHVWVNPARAIRRSAEEGLGLAELSLVPPVPAAARVLCVGLNYPAHVAEGTFQRPTHPSVFGRWTRSLTVSGTPAPVPSGEQGLDWEGELVAVVGQTLKNVSAVEALQAVFGYAAFNDLTAPQTPHRTPQWTVGKNADPSGPTSRIRTL